MTECLEVAREQGWTNTEAIVLLNLSSVKVALRRWDEAREALEASLADRRARGDLAGLAVVLPALGYVRFELGDVPGSLELCTEGLAACRAVGNDVDGWFAAFCRSVIQLADGSVRPALRDAAAAMRACVPGRPYEIACTQQLLAAAFAAVGKGDLAADYRRRFREADAAYRGATIASVQALLARCQASN
jgi:hypothetical protein